MEEPAKGTVTSLSSLFPANEALKASKHVQGAITERQKELDQLRSFIADNTNLINLVQKLPEELHHDIMVPFGKAAFFPGRLVHTNEFLVLLGEGYYAERTSKQTIDILKRRGKTLESQVESLKAVMQDLKAEASFFDSTAAEVAEGLVEIREEYKEESSAEVVPKAGLGKSEADCMKVAIQEDEYAHIMARMDELEQEELAAESVSESDGDEECAHVMSKLELEGYEHSVERVSKYGEDNSPKADFGHCRSQHVLDNKHKSPEAKEEHNIGEALPCKLTVQQDLGNQVEGLQVQSVSEDKSSSDQGFGLTKSSSEGKVFVLPGVEENVQVELLPEKAFIGSIVEHTHNMRGQADSSSKSTTPTTSKPVSRFKMQRKSNV